MRLLLLAFTVLALGGCRCPICYEDQWSRTPFPGEQTQHIPPEDPQDIPN
jgi:hypothetical protein